MVASGNLEWSSLLQAHIEAIPKSVPIIALSFVYQVSLGLKSYIDSILYILLKNLYYILMDLFLVNLQNVVPVICTDLEGDLPKIR